MPAPERHRSRPIASVAVVLVALLALCLLSGCTGDGSAGKAPPGASSDWVAFGPFEKPAKFADDPGVTGASEIFVPEVGVVALDAEELLPDMKIESERYAYAYDGEKPIIVGVIQVEQTLYYRRDTEKLKHTYVLGISAEAEPKVISQFRAVRGSGAHSVRLTGLTNLGVVVIFAEGELKAGDPRSTRLAGIDAVRGTEVWRKPGGYPGPGAGTSADPATFYIAPAPDACAEKVEQYEVASGVTIRAEELKGATCKRASDSG